MVVLAGGPDFTNRKNADKNFVAGAEAVGGAPATPFQTIFVTAGLALVVLLASLDVMPLVKGMAFLLACMLALGMVGGSELRRRFPFELWLIIGSALTLAQALNNSGLVEIIATFLHDNLATLGPWFALAGVYFGTLLLTETMTNNAAAALAFPIAFGLAESYGLSPMPFIMAVAYGASASFLTPYGYTTNLMVQNLGQYSFGDYTRAGLPMSIVYTTVVLVLVPIVFPF